MVVIKLKKRKISEFEEDSEFEEITLVDSLTKEKEVLFLLFLFKKTQLPEIWNKIKSFLNMFEYYECEKTLSGRNTPDRHTRSVLSVFAFQDDRSKKVKIVSGSGDNSIKLWS